jgi:hypothetical protein
VRILGTKAHVAVGLAAIVTSAVVFAMLLGLLPDRLGAQREGRVSLAESVAASASALLTAQEERRLDSVLHFIMSRNPEVLSIAVRERSGRIRVSAGEHTAHWEAIEGGLSSDTQLLVPIWADQRRWGQLEMRFKPLTSPGIRGVAEWPGVALMAFLASAWSLSTSISGACCAARVARDSGAGARGADTLTGACWSSIAASISCSRTSRSPACSENRRRWSEPRWPPCPGWAGLTPPELPWTRALRDCGSPAQPDDPAEGFGWRRAHLLAELLARPRRR